MELGKLTLNEFNNYEGLIQGLGLGAIQIVTQRAASKDDKVFHRIIADPKGNPYEIGSMWPREKNGAEYFSVSLDSPLFAKPINAAVFPDKVNPKILHFVWQRQKPNTDLTAQHDAVSTVDQETAQDDKQEKLALAAASQPMNIRRKASAAPKL